MKVNAHRGEGRPGLSLHLWILHRRWRQSWHDVGVPCWLSLCILKKDVVYHAMRCMLCLCYSGLDSLIKLGRDDASGNLTAPRRRFGSRGWELGK